MINLIQSKRVAWVRLYLAHAVQFRAGKKYAYPMGPRFCELEGEWHDPQQTGAAFDDEGFFCSGDAVKWFDPENHDLGSVFDARVAQDFKLDTGTWVKYPLKINCGCLRLWPARCGVVRPLQCSHCGGPNCITAWLCSVPGLRCNPSDQNHIHLTIYSAWVLSVGTLRARVAHEGAPCLQDSAITGHDRREVGMLILPSLLLCRTLSVLRPYGKAREVLESGPVRDFSRHW